MRWTVGLSITLAAIAALGAVGAGFGYRFDLWSLGTAFSVLRGSAYLGIAAAVLSLLAVAYVFRRARYRLLLPVVAALIVGLAAAAIPYEQLQIARAVPPIHDITTDTEEPPRFVAVLPLRADAPNPPDYPGAHVAAQQRQAYPGIRPAMLEARPAQAFDRALSAARGLGWTVVAAAPGEGRIEATDQTFWFGFKDDVVIRIRAADGGSRVDVRSKSRIGRSDVGANARRIHRFLARLETKAGDR